MGTSAAVDVSVSSYELCDYIAHEMANPLNGMLMSVELLEEKLRTIPCAMGEVAELPGILKKEIHRLILLLNALRVSDALLASEVQPVSLPKEIGELLALESGYYAKRGIEVHSDIPLNLPRIMADRNRLRQAVFESLPERGRRNAEWGHPHSSSLRKSGLLVPGHCRHRRGNSEGDAGL